MTNQLRVISLEEWKDAPLKLSMFSFWFLWIL